ncbi:unnamed protein product, partial [Hapterophycus canaliculatus]
MRAEEGPVSKINLRGMFGWKNLPFQISEEEESRVKALGEIAQSYLYNRNNGREFDQPEGRDRLESILNEQPGFFYAQHLLGTWHLRNGDAQEGKRLIEEALKSAPVVLTQRCRFGNGEPLQNARVQQFTIECN